MRNIRQLEKRSNDPPDRPQDRYRRLFNPPALSPEARRQRAASPDRPPRPSAQEEPVTLPWDDPNKDPETGFHRGWYCAESFVHVPGACVNGFLSCLEQKGQRYVDAIAEFIKHAVRRGGRR